MRKQIKKTLYLVTAALVLNITGLVYWIYNGNSAEIGFILIFISYNAIVAFSLYELNKSLDLGRKFRDKPMNQFFGQMIDQVKENEKRYDQNIFNIHRRNN